MRLSTLLTVLCSLFFLNTSAQRIGQYSVSLKAKTIAAAPGLQSFVFGQYQGKWLLIGGRTDGLHMRQPPFTFKSTENNKSIFVIDPQSGQVWPKPLSELGGMLEEQLQSTNMQHEQVDTSLFITGGYAYSASEGDHTTFPYLSIVDVPGTIDAIINGKSIKPFFTQIKDTLFQVTGGQMEYLNDTFYLVGGQKFLGRYNPMGPTHGPGFIQEYTNEIRKFRAENNSGSISIKNKSVIRDSAELHRRDYNMIPQIFPNGKMGLTVFSGVFQYVNDLPWLNTVDIINGNYKVKPGFNQYLNQYHTAYAPIYDSINNEMHSIFFGGIGRYYFDSTGTLIDDQNVPFVKTISMISRNSAGLMKEKKIGLMPDFLGSSAEFIVNPSIGQYKNEIVKLDKIKSDTTFLGHIYGGIKSTQENIFFINTGIQSTASKVIYEVYLIKDTTTNIEMLNAEKYFNMKLYPNPTKGKLRIEFKLRKKEKQSLALYDINGQLIKTLSNKVAEPGLYYYDLDTFVLNPGIYFIRIDNREFSQTLKFVRE